MTRSAMLVTFDDVEKEKRWSCCLNALEKDYTTSTRDLCKMLKCSRSWVNEYIQPFIHYVFISNGSTKKTARFTKLASIALGKDIKDSIWFNTKEVKQYLMSHFTSCSRQTIKIPIEALVAHDRLSNFKNDYSFYTNQINSLLYRDYRLAMKFIKARDELIKSSLSEVGELIYLDLPSKYKRTMCSTVDLPLPNFELSELIAVHDLLDYGDTKEMVYRDLFENGYYRIELCLHNLNNEKTKKVYYLKPRWDSMFEGELEYITIKYEYFAKFLATYESHS